MKVLLAAAFAAAGLALTAPVALADGNNPDFYATQWTQNHPLPVMPGGDAYGPQADRFFAEQGAQASVSGNQEQANEMRATAGIHRHVRHVYH